MKSQHSAIIVLLLALNACLLLYLCIRIERTEFSARQAWLAAEEAREKAEEAQVSAESAEGAAVDTLETLKQHASDAQ